MVFGEQAFNPLPSTGCIFVQPSVHASHVLFVGPIAQKPCVCQAFDNAGNECELLFSIHLTENKTGIKFFGCMHLLSIRRYHR